MIFELLSNASEATATRVAYEVSLRLFERERIRSREALDELDATYQRARLRLGAGQLASAPEHEIVAWVLGEIERREGKRLPDLTDAEAGEYISGLARVLDEHVRHRPQYDERRGRALLEALRQQYRAPAA